MLTTVDTNYCVCQCFDAFTVIKYVIHHLIRFRLSIKELPQKELRRIFKSLFCHCLFWNQ